MRKASERGFAAAGVLTLLLAACGPRPDGPAPVISGEAAATPEPEWIRVQPGQTLSGIAHAYHVPTHLIAEANHLAPPYHIEAGRSLIIPQADQSPLPLGTGSLAALPPPKSEEVTTSKPLEAAPLERMALPPAGNPPIAGTAPPNLAAPAPSLVAEPPHPDVKPAAAPLAPAAMPEPPAASSVPPSTAAESGTFLWPVRGRVLAGYGPGRDGTHNDGINIAAPRGAAVEAADGGVVAYVGNELRGYGNLILVKHPNGWISAYAHCDSILVKRGDKVVRGQTIARVGSTGSVAEPQLHFELRHGSRAVDPREFLAPLPTAGTERRTPPG
ncbi:MAG: M23 family metallopeptidase [Alphaproteobacteria bacterium]|nr:M23 family metallopeptidase [Alphaproteobacteria bacterium]